MKTLDYVACGNYFVAMNSELVNVEVYEVCLFTDGDVMYKAKSNEKYLTLKKDTKFFASVESFMKGVVADKVCIDERAICSHLNCRYVEENKFRGWVFDDEIAEERTFTVCCITIKGDTIASVSGTEQSGRALPNKCYRSRQDVLDNNIVKVVDEQGNVSTLVGIKIKTRLDKDQQAMANELKELVEKMRASGMTIVYDDINATISAINTRNIGKVHTYCMCGEENYEHELDYEDMTIIVSIDSRVDDSYVLGIDKEN